MLFDVARHVEMNLALCIVPVKMNSDVSGAGPVCLDCIVGLECFHQVALVFDPKIINNQGEVDSSHFVVPKPRD